MELLAPIRYYNKTPHLLKLHLRTNLNSIKQMNVLFYFSNSLKPEKLVIQNFLPTDSSSIFLSLFFSPLFFLWVETWPLKYLIYLPKSKIFLFSNLFSFNCRLTISLDVARSLFLYWKQFSNHNYQVINKRTFCWMLQKK